jgi:hypothetical protein
LKRGWEIVGLSLAFIGSQYQIYECVQAIPTPTTHDQSQKTMIAPLTLIVPWDYTPYVIIQNVIV